MENLKNYCKIHNVAMVKCAEENCERNTNGICKFCALNSKELLNHLSEHFDHVKESNFEDFDSVDNFSKKLKSDEEYGDLNKIFLDMYVKADSSIDSIFLDVLKRQVIMKQQFRNTLLTKYENFTIELEDLVKTLSEKLNSLSSLSPKLKDDIFKLKKDLDSKLNLLSNPQEIYKELEQLIMKIENILKKLKVEDILNDKFNLDILYKVSCNLELSTGGNRINVTPRGSSYWITKSEEILEGAFICKISVISINSVNAGNYWSYSVGIIKADFVGNETSYYNDSIIIQSNGYVPEKFSGSGSTRQLFFEKWKNDDLIFIKRDENNSLFFGLNDENSFQLAYSNISGPFRIVMGFGSTMDGDIFELKELVKV
jgi:hypothetical protein